MSESLVSRLTKTPAALLKPGDIGWTINTGPPETRGMKAMMPVKVKRVVAVVELPTSREETLLVDYLYMVNENFGEAYRKSEKITDKLVEEWRVTNTE